MSYLSHDDILKIDDLEVRDLDVPEWGGTVRVKALSGKERANYQLSITQFRGDEAIPNLTNIQAKLVARVIVDEDGKRMFSDQEINALGEKSGATLERIFNVGAEMAGLSDENIAQAAANLDETPSDESTSGSPETSDAPSPSSSPESAPAS